ncbi:MAG TPA: gliding motility-associated lipoprotein [Flavobacteriales bacterium]|nr:gliding motility-associated lipoprotein [Flavobacteriales bacterium]HIA06784.1 gliding motility-associated lipoprotein [Flavobacteriales bacterium]
MKKLVFVIIVMPVILWGCGSGGSGELFGVQGRLPWFQPDPYGMLYLPMGAYHMGPSDQDVPYSQTAAAKPVSVQSFYMDQTEITNNEYRQFVYWVRDSLARRILGEEVSDDYFHMVDAFDQELDPPQLNWDEPIYWEEDEQREALDQMFLPEHERFYRRKRIDTRKLNFEYYRIDLRAAAQKSNREQGLKDRSVFIIKDIIGVYPDTLAWVHDFTYSFNEPMTRMYFWHPAYDNYPVVGVNWVQARAFCIWRSELLNSFLLSNGGTMVNDFRLPTESEWEYASRGGLDLSPYPWGGPYIRNSNGCFLANFKPMRGNYIDDGGFHTVVVTSYSPNEFGLYCMSGNVAEWTSNAYDESAYNFAHDLNQDYLYEAKDSDPPALKRKVIRGGSWKDVMYYLQNGTRTYEYQDTAKSYIGFRSVMTYLGRAKGDEL